VSNIAPAKTAELSAEKTAATFSDKIITIRVSPNSIYRSIFNDFYFRFLIYLKRIFSAYLFRFKLVDFSVSGVD
jgi:hypothetical protein